MSYASFNPSYQGNPPWEISRPQSAIVALAEDGGFALASLGQSFDTVLDSAFMHIPGNTAARRRAYTHQLAAVLPAGGWVHLLEISELVTEHPSITRAEIVDAFDDRWTVPRIHPATYAITTGEVPAWLANVQRR